MVLDDEDGKKRSKDGDDIREREEREKDDQKRGVKKKVAQKS